MRDPIINSVGRLATRAIVCVFIAGVWCARVRGDEEFFRETVAPIFERRCVQCHGADFTKGKLRLDTAEHALAGGDSGQVIDPGDPNASLLIDYISGEKPEM